ncbi:MAG: hypothetical protein Q8N99_04640 [Nanoarchaeota archaeon]|nr:hypothetical protein [Nanoarchaeota archaeon]
MEKAYEKVDRFQRVDISERVAKTIVRQIDYYAEVHEIYPADILIQAEELPLDYCATIVRDVLRRRNIPTAVRTSNNGDIAGLTFNLDEMGLEFIADSHLE